MSEHPAPWHVDHETEDDFEGWSIRDRDGHEVVTFGSREIAERITQAINAKEV